MAAFTLWLLRTWYSPRPLWFLTPLAWLFAVLSGLRRAAYRAGVFGQVSLPVPVIVVGNITVGGTGKTPFVLWLVAALVRRGHKVGIVTRGYGGRYHEASLADAASDPQRVGDEAVLLARKSGVPVAVGRDRVGAAQLLLKHHALDLIVSDDGLQHYRLPRRHEIVMLDQQRGLGNGWLLPAGPLRESEARLATVQQVVIKETAGGSFDWPGAVHMGLAIDTAVSLKDGARRPLHTFAGAPSHALAGIGNPEQFFAALRAAGLNVEGRALPDHAQPTAADLDFGDAHPVFMTEKDAVKCRGMVLDHHWYVEATTVFDGDDAGRILAGLESLLANRPRVNAVPR